MTSTESPHGLQVHDDKTIPSPTKPESLETALLLPDIPELLTHLRLIDAIICLKNAIDVQGQAYGKEAGKAWEQFCRAAAVKFIEWSENVDVSDKTIPIPPLDILMIWHSYMLNTKDYVQFQDKARRGELAGKSFDWHELERKLELDYDGMSDILGLWDPSEKTQTQTPALENLSPAHDFDMVAAVQRQLKFAEKVHRAQWRHPEMINNFLDSAIGNYKEFFTLIAENPGVGLAPTLAIDLVWHTHQLSPRRYRTYSRHMTNGRFVHHDDNIDESSLEEASHNAEELYFAKYGVPYKRCACPAPGEDIWCIVCFAGPRTPPNGCFRSPTSDDEKQLLANAIESWSRPAETEPVWGEPTGKLVPVTNCCGRWTPLSNCTGPSTSDDEEHGANAASPPTPSVNCFGVATSGDDEEPGVKTGGGAVAKREDSSCSTACRSGCSVACRSGCGNYCRGGLCRDQCRAACGYVCGACDTKELASETYQGPVASRSGVVDSSS